MYIRKGAIYLGPENEIRHSRRGTTVSVSAPDAQTSTTTSTGGHTEHLGTAGAYLQPGARRQKKRMLRGDSARRVKHATDRIIALSGLLLLAPLLVAIAIAVFFGDRGPALFSQERIGLKGKPFRMWKFRSMRVEADSELVDLVREHGLGHEPLIKIPGDPRVTAIGRFLRRWSLDELPQLWNVVLGQMSLVGPRPHIPADVALYNERALERLRVRPGITGLWQVSGRTQSWKPAIILDLHYVENWSLLLDVQILIRTIGAVLSGRGAL
jgi:lipopolysaccharide/colanic/teichoic acid biosynthesis glycosyltransferase